MKYRLVGLWPDRQRYSPLDARRRAAILNRLLSVARRWPQIPGIASPLTLLISSLLLVLAMRTDSIILALAVALPLLFAVLLGTVLAALIGGQTLPLGMPGAGFAGPSIEGNMTLTAYGGGTVDELELDARDAGAAAILVWYRDRALTFFVDAQAGANVEFREMFPDGLPAGQPVLVVGSGWGSTPDEETSMRERRAQQENESESRERAQRSPEPPQMLYGSGMSPGDEIEVLAAGVILATGRADELGRWVIQISPQDFESGRVAAFRVNGRETDVEERMFPGGTPADVREGVDLRRYRSQ